MFVFLFSSRRRHTRSTRDWSSDVCSSDLVVPGGRSPDGTVGAAVAPDSPAPEVTAATTSITVSRRRPATRRCVPRNGPVTRVNNISRTPPSPPGGPSTAVGSVAQCAGGFLLVLLRSALHGRGRGTD